MPHLDQDITEFRSEEFVIIPKIRYYYVFQNDGEVPAFKDEKTLEITNEMEQYATYIGRIRKTETLTDAQKQKRYREAKKLKELPSPYVVYHFTTKRKAYFIVEDQSMNPSQPDFSVGETEGRIYGEETLEKGYCFAYPSIFEAQRCFGDWGVEVDEASLLEIKLEEPFACMRWNERAITEHWEILFDPFTIESVKEIKVEWGKLKWNQ
jgi:hypothetical protein